MGIDFFTGARRKEKESRFSFIHPVRRRRKKKRRENERVWVESSEVEVVKYVKSVIAT